MDANPAKPRDIDEYIAGFPKGTQVILEKVRMTIRAAAPQAEETIKYGMPTFTLEGNLVYFAAYKKHIGFYGASSAVETFKAELSGLVGEKGSIRFPIDKPIPYDLISRMVLFRVRENLERAEAKQQKKKQDG